MATLYLDFDAATNGSGTIGSPFNSFASAEAAVTPGDTVMVSGTYRGTITFNPAKGGVDKDHKTSWLGSLTNPFIVKGTEVLSGLTRCTIADQVDVGANYNSIFKVTVPLATFPNSNPLAANILENNQQLTICVARADTSDTFFITRPQYYYTGETIRSGTNIVGFRLPSVTDLYTQAQIENSTVLYVAKPNVSATSAVASYDTTTKIINLATTSAVYEDSTVRDNFALRNLLPAMKVGEWGYKISGSNVTMYVWPTNEAHIATGIEYSARNNGININGTPFLEVAYFRVIGVAPNTLSQAGIINNGFASQFVHLHHFQVLDCLNAGSAYAGIYLNSINDLVMHNFDIRRMQGMYGVFLAGTGASNADAGNPQLVNTMKRARVYDGSIAYTAQSPFRVYTVAHSAFYHLVFWQCARQSHGNTMNFYQGCYNNLIWGVDGWGSDGYFTHQESTDTCWVLCAGSASKAASGGARTFTQQQNAIAKQADVYGYLQSYFINCFATPNGVDGRLNYYNSCNWSSALAPNDRWTVANNHYHGHQTETFAQADLWDYNITTAGAGHGANDELVNVYDTYVNPDIDDFRFKPGARVRTKIGRDMTADIAALQARFSGVFDRWNQDLHRNAIDWAAPPCYCSTDFDAPIGGEARGSPEYAGLAGTPPAGGTQRNLGMKIRLTVTA